MKLDPYIGVKPVKGCPMEKDGVDGYFVEYPDGYQSWSPKKAFESAYFRVKNYNSLCEEDLDNFIKHTEVIEVGENTVFVKVTLLNDYVLTESVSCIITKNFDKAEGVEICLERIREKLRRLLFFVMSWSIHGISGGQL